MKERCIGENLRVISDILQYTENEGFTVFLVSLDFRKTFDTLEWPFTKGVLNLFNIGGKSRFFTPSLKMQFWTTGLQRIGFSQKGKSKKVPPPPPPPCHNMRKWRSNKIRRSKLVKWINIYGNEVKVSQFADDITSFAKILPRSIKVSV